MRPATHTTKSNDAPAIGGERRRMRPGIPSAERCIAHTRAQGAVPRAGYPAWHVAYATVDRLPLHSVPSAVTELAPSLLLADAALGDTHVTAPVACRASAETSRSPRRKSERCSLDMA